MYVKYVVHLVNLKKKKKLTINRSLKDYDGLKCII